MRPGQNKRMRGRNNRKGPNPLSRTYESNGPDVKIRGTAHHVAEKYLQLARDAHSSGDPVMAESYLQHAEHYFRLIAAAQQAQQQAQQGYMRPSTESEPDDGDDDDDFGGVPDRFASPQERIPQPPQQPFPQQQPAPVAYGVGPQPYLERGGERPHHERGERGPQERGPQERGPQDRGPQERGPQDRGPRQFQDRNHQRRRGPENRPPVGEQPQPRFEPRSVQAPTDEPAPGLPAFITGGAPRPAPAPVEGPASPAAEPPIGADADHDAASFHLRSRRRRRRPGDGENQPAAGELPLAD